MIKHSPATASATAFACNLFVHLAEAAPQRNTFISPASIALALAMVYNGACGDTRRAIARTLELDESDTDDLNEANAALQQQLSQLDSHIQIAIANALWVSDTFQLDCGFVHTVEHEYQAAVQTLDFAHQPVAQIVNDWVAAHTAGKITRLIDQLDRDTLLLLVNAIYFKGQWTEPFNRQLTQDGPFTLPGERQIQVPMMAQRSKYRYYEDRAFQAVALPYGGGRVCMYIVLPRPDVSLERFIHQLNGKDWERWMTHFSNTEGRLVLPRFRIAYEVKLNNTLKDMGMGIAFDRRADFSAMAGDGAHLHIDEVRHKSFIEVNEEGTEAAAVTSVSMMRASFAPQKLFSMVVDRPFFCAIRDERSGTMLFMGAIVDPS